MKQYRSVPFSSVRIQSGFWQDRQRLNREQTIDSVMHRFKETGRFAALDCDWREGMPNKPHIFYDSDIAKWVESVAYLIHQAPMPGLECEVEAVVDQIERNQRHDGYFNVWFTAIEPTKRFTQRWAHELYCAGHLIEAAVAYWEATGKDRFLNLMRRYADYIERVFKIEQSAAFGTPGHEEIELALVKLYRATDERRYLELAKWFVDRRGNNDLDRPDSSQDAYANQSHLPVREMETAEGHAVRAVYLYSAMADLAAEYGDASLLRACQRIFQNIAARRMYVTGGIGSSNYAEAFTVDYDLQNEIAYTETCASIGLAFFARRMLALELNSAYADAVEAVLYNGFLASTSLDGKSFFYSNPMEIDLSHHGRNVSSAKSEWLPAPQRVEVFSCSCCPPNITRFVATLGDLLYTQDDQGLYVHQYMGSEATLTIGGRSVSVSQVTDYPREGVLRLRVTGASGLRVGLRIPGWCAHFTLSAPYVLENGYALLECASDDCEWTLTLDLTPTLWETHPAVHANAGRAALRRGPVLYCLEGVDNGADLQNLMIQVPLEAQVQESDVFPLPLLLVRGRQPAEAAGEWLYRPFQGALAEKSLTFIPYYCIANRGPSDMQLWVRVRL